MKAKWLCVIATMFACLVVAFVAQATTFTSFSVTDQTPTAPLANPVPASFQPRYISGFGLDNTFSVFFEDRDAGSVISYVSTSTGPTGFPAATTGTTVIPETHFCIKDWPINVGGTDYDYRGWGSVGNNTQHTFYVSNDLVNWVLVNTFTIPNHVSFTGARGWVYYGFHDVILINGTYYAFAESNQGQTMLVRSANGDDVWEAFAGVGGTQAADGPLQMPESPTPSGSFVDLGYDRGYGKLQVRGNDSGCYLAVNSAAQASLAPALLEAAFINPANWTWDDGSTGLPTVSATPVLLATGEHDVRECWAVPNSDPDADWVIMYDADFGVVDGGKALGYATLTPPPPPPVHNITQGIDYKTIQAAVDAANPGDVIECDAGTYTEYVIINIDDLTIVGAGIDQSIIDLDGLTPYWHYGGCSSSFASRAGVYFSGYGNADEVVENCAFRGFTVKNAGLNPPNSGTGTHTGGDNGVTLTDAGASFPVPDGLVGQWVHNYGDRDLDYKPARSYGQITANTATTVTATLSGGVENDWDTGDEYIITPYEEFYNSYWVYYPNYDGMRGISIGNGKNIRINECKVTDCGYGGITTGYARCVSTHKYSEGIVIDSCVVTDHPSAGISIGSNAGYFAVTNSTCERIKTPHYADATREYAGHGIQVSGSSSTLRASGVISNNTCSDNGFEGIIIKKYADGITIDGNTVTGHNLDQDGAGIFCYHWDAPEYCTNIAIRNNTITGNIRGVVAYYAEACTIEVNTITTDAGTFAHGQGAIKLDNANNILVRNNTISCDGTGITVMSYDSDDNAHGNTFEGNTITGAEFAGVMIYGPYARDNTFTGNTITGTTMLTLWAGETYEETQGDGVFLDDDAGTGNTFLNNNIYGNADDGLENQLATEVEATCNWWGAVSGPYHILNPAGTGNDVEGSVAFSPWLTGSYPGGACDGYPPDNIAVDPLSVRCLSYNLPCDTVDVLFSRLDTTPVRGVSVTFELSSELELCGNIYSSVREGAYLSNIGGTHFQVTSLGGGLYTVDCAILGIPCGATADGVLFTIDIKGSGGDGTGTVTVTSVTVRDCSNGPVVAFPGAPVDVTIDHTSPVAISDLAASQVKSGNDSDGTTEITLTFTAPGDAAVVEVYRAPYGDYPEYDDGTGAEPAAPVSYSPGAPWVLTSVTASGQTDEVANRDFWYYVVYTKDACGNVSVVSNKTTGTLNYHLGDVTDGSTPGTGDNLVNSVDISKLGTHYWSTLIHNDPVNYLDVGPTTDYSVDALPTTDNQVQFEDLMMFAINFGQVSLLADLSPRMMEYPDLSLVVDSGIGDIVTARVVLEGNRSSVKGLHAAIDYGAGLELVSFSKGGLWIGQGGPIFLEHLDEGGVVQVDGAVLGRGLSINGSGAVCELRFRVVGTVTELPHLVSADLRDRDNGGFLMAAERKDVMESESLTRVEFAAAPNPFSGGTALHFAIPSSDRVSLRVFDVNGRLVTTLVDENLSAGRHRVVWESADVSPGVYMAILQAGTERETRKLTLLP